jgi:hypothetical protein
VSGFGDDVYQPDPSDQPDIEQLDDSDTLIDGVGDPLDEGYIPLDRPIGLRGHESFDQRLADELPDPWTDGYGDGRGDRNGDKERYKPGARFADGDGIGDSTDSDGELLDDQVGDRRAGRLVAPNEGFGEDYTSDMVARDVGIDGAAASAEEAAMHVVGEDLDEQEVETEREEATAAEQ